MKRRTAMSLFIAAAIAGSQMASNFSEPLQLQSSTLSCVGTSTYDFQPLTTVTETVTEGFDFTFLANGSTASDYFYTPPPPCSSVIVPPMTNSSSQQYTVITYTSYPNASTPVTTAIPITSYVTYWTTICSTITPGDTNTTAKQGGPYINTTAPVLTTECKSTQTFSTTTVTSTTTLAAGDPRIGPVPLVPSSANGPAKSTQFESFSASVFVSTVPVGSASAESSAALSKTAATVTVTKKTPVPINQQSTTPGGGSGGASITFPDPGGDDPIIPASNNAPGQTSTKPVTFPSQTPGATPNNSPPPAPGGTGASGGSSGNGSPGGQASTSGSGNGLGSIINSAFNSPFTSVGVSTSFGAASATVTLVGGVPVQVESSSVYIGGSIVALPTGSSSVFVTIAGETFTVGPSGVVGAGTTLTIQRSESISYSAVQAADLPVSTITQNGVVVTVEPTAAIISGTTYSIGLNAEPTTITVNGQVITLNSNGVAFASTTYRPAITTAPAYVISTIGQLTFSIDETEAIISGTTYRIGAGALNSKTTAVIDGTTIVFGPSGIVLPSTTIAPTEVPFTTGSSRTGASAATRIVSNTDSARSSGFASTSISRPPAFLSNTFCILVMLAGMGTLPLSILL